MSETRSPAAEVVVVAGAERLRVTGRAAVIIAEIALHADQINQIPVGRVVADFARAKTRLEVSQSYSAVRIDLSEE